MPLISRLASAAARAYGMFAAVSAAVDPFFNYVTALLHGDGTNGAQNNTFLDSSTNNFTITRNGNTTQGTFSPFSQTGWSAYFDGNGDYINFTNQATTGNCTCECWFYRGENVTGYNIIFGGSNASSSNPNNVQLQVDNNGAVAWYMNGSVIAATGTAVTRNAWNHIAWVRSGTSCAIFVNGLRIATGTSSAALNVDRIGTIGGVGPGTYDALGYISNARITTTAVYDVTQTTYTVPTTPLTAISGTYLLTLQSNRFVDNSASPLTLTVNGNTSVQAFSPFNPTSAWSASSNGGSGYFDGSGDYLSAPSNATYSFAGNFTWECWVYFTTLSPANQALFGNYTANVSTDWYIDTSGSTLRVYIDGGVAARLSTTVVANMWNHVAIVRNGSTITGYLNGASFGTYSTSATIGSGSKAIYIGSQGGAAEYLNGYLTDVRIVNGTAVYTAAFTPPTAPLTAITNTSLLLNYTNAGIYDNAAVGDYETVGNAQVSTSVVKYGTGSMAFDGTGDYLVTNAASTQQFAFGTGDFTIEGWIYPTSVAAGVHIIYDSRPSSTQGIYPTIYLNGAVITFFVNSADRITGPSLSVNTWYHFAVCRVASQTKMFINGTQVGSTYADTNSYLNGASRPSIGASGFSAAADTYFGYIDDLRITKGVGRYPYNFTPPAAAFPNIGGTVTLTADPYYNYTTLLLPGNGTNGAQNNTFLDSSSNAFTITRNGNTTQGNFSPFSQTGWGNYVSANNYLSIADNAAFQFGSGDYTIECWINLSAITAGGGIISYGPAGALTNSWALEYNSGTSALSFWMVNANPATYIINGTTNPVSNQWMHVAVSRSGNNTRLFINGTQEGSTYTSTYTSGTGNNLYIGAGSYAPSTRTVTGYISNLRIVKGTGLYTANFTPSTTPLTAVSGTTLLTCQANRFLDASSSALTITLGGTPSVQAFSPFAPTAAWSASTNGGSGYFDGSGDYLTAGSAISLSGSFTVEGWVYITSTAANTILFALGDDFTSTGFSVFVSTTGQPRVLSNNAYPVSGSAGQVGINQWNHIAFVRNSTSLTLYVNGVSVGTGTSSATFSGTAYIGAENYNTTIFPTAAGYSSNVRVVTSAVYTAAFTPPTAPLTAISGTSLLLSATNGGIVDATAKNDLETVGNAQISTTQSKFGGSSMYFDGTGDQLSSPNSLFYDFGGGDFTIEAWLYPTTASQLAVAARSQNTGFVGWILSTTNFLATTNSSSWDITITFTNALTANSWNHIAIVRYGNVYTAYKNGVANGTTTVSGSIVNGTAAFVIGQRNGQTDYSGYIDDLRITKGIARYTSNFTPPTSAFLLQ